ncbi:MAG: sulfotransferase [bacterium]
MNSSPIFIVGCPRSGTSLLCNLLRSHPRIAIPG